VINTFEIYKGPLLAITSNYGRIERAGLGQVSPFFGNSVRIQCLFSAYSVPIQCIFSAKIPTMTGGDPEYFQEPR
jgi:hypothetical protein